MRNWQEEFDKRVEYIKKKVESTHSKGIIYGNSGGKDCTLVSILCKAACDNTVGIIMPCSSKRNYEIDKFDAEEVAAKYGIENRVVDLTPARNALVSEYEKVADLNNSALINIAPRLRMTTLYTIAAAESRLVAGTGNRSEIYIGYFTKWGDGASDFNPISDLTATEVFEFLRYLDAPKSITEKAPSAGLFEGQTDEDEIGVKYSEIDRYITTGEIDDLNKKEIIDRMHRNSEHKRVPIGTYEGEKL